MRTDKTRKTAVFLLAAIAAAVVMCLFAYAADRRISLSYVVDGAKFDIYRIADIKNGEIVPTADFEQYNVDLYDTSAASTLETYVLRDKPTAYASAVTSELKAEFEVEDGVYLILGNSVKQGRTSYIASPVIASVGGADIEINGKYETKQTGGSTDDDTPSGGDKENNSSTTSKDGSTPRGGSSSSLVNRDKKNSTSDTLSAVKVWRGGRGDSVTVQLLNGGDVVEEVKLDSSNNWRYTWEDLDKDGDWRVAEKTVPDGFKVSVDRSGESWVITNTSDTYIEEHPEDSSENISENNENTEIFDNENIENIDGHEPQNSENGGTDTETPAEPASEDEYGIGSGDGTNIDSGGISADTVNSDSSDGTPTGGRLPQTGQPWLPAAGLAFAGVICLAIGEYRKADRNKR